MQESIDAVKLENEELKDQRSLFESQLLTLKNVNDSQQKIIDYLNKSNMNNDMVSSPKFFNHYQSEMRAKDFTPDLSVISEDEKVANCSKIENLQRNSYTESNNNENEESENESNISKNMLKYKINTEEENDKTDEESIDRNRRSYQDIITSFKSIHDKIEKWNQK